VENLKLIELVDGQNIKTLKGEKMSHPDRGAGKGSLTLRERQALRRGQKVYRNGISVDRRGNPIVGDLDEEGRDRSQWGISGSNIDRFGNAILPTSPDYFPNFDDDDPGIDNDGFGDDGLGNVVDGGDAASVPAVPEALPVKNEVGGGKRPKRTYNEETGEWEVERLWDSRDDDGKYWKDGVQVDSSGRPWQETEDAMIKYYETNENTSTPGTGVGGGDVPDVGDQTITIDDPKNLDLDDPDDPLFYGGKGFSVRTKGSNPYLKIKKKTQGKQGKFTRGSLRVRKPRRTA